MKTTNEKLDILNEKIKQGNIKIMIMGLGSVGLYLLDYILSKSDQNISIVVAGRNLEKMTSDVNIVRVASLIRNQNRSNIQIDGDCDLTNIKAIENCIKRHNPNFIVNTSRVYAGLKYGSISWKSFRSYGIWSPLAISFIRNIMEACDKAATDAIIINTSYSDAVIPWLKSANLAYPDFGSGNLNHLIPRIKFAAAEIKSIKDFWNIDVTLVTSHFHDVVISKEGQTEGQNPLIDVSYHNKSLDINMKQLYSMCKIAMPVDAKRNMMNASSNFDIIFSIIEALKNKEKRIFHSPGAFGFIGGYPVVIDGNSKKCHVDESKFSINDMVSVNKKSLYLDGIESIENGILTYTDTLLEKVRTEFGVDLPKEVPFSKIDDISSFIIENIIKKGE